MAPIDIVQAQAEVATNESSVIVAEAAIKAAQDNLRALILDPGAPDFWTRRPSSRPTRRRSTRAADRRRCRGAQRARQAVRPPAARRTRSSRATSTSSTYANQIKPDVNASVGYNPVGRRRQPVERRSTSRTSRPASRRTGRSSSPVGFGSVLGDVLQSSYPTWTFGVTIAYPLGANTAHANLARVRLEYRAGADAAQEHRDAGDARGARRRAQREDQPAARPVGARVARAAGAEARGGGEEARRRHVVALLRRPGAARSRRSPARPRSRRSPTTTSRSSTSKPCSRCRSTAGFGNSQVQVAR